MVKPSNQAEAPQTRNWGNWCHNSKVCTSSKPLLLAKDILTDWRKPCFLKWDVLDKIKMSMVGTNKLSGYW